MRFPLEALRSVPEALLEQLKPGGRMVIPASRRWGLCKVDADVHSLAMLKSVVSMV